MIIVIPGESFSFEHIFTILPSTYILIHKVSEVEEESLIAALYLIFSLGSLYR